MEIAKSKIWVFLFIEALFSFKIILGCPTPLEAVDKAASCVYTFAKHIPIHDVCYMDIPLHSLLPLLHIYGFCIMNNQFHPA